MMGRPTRRALDEAKSKSRTGGGTTRKRFTTISVMDKRASNIQKTIPKANSGKTVKGRGTCVTDAVVISDDENDIEEHRPLTRTESLTPPQEMIKHDTSDTKDPIDPTPVYTNSLGNEPVQTKVAHSKELAQLRLQLVTAEDQAVKVKHEADENHHEFLRQSVTSDKHMADLGELLEAEKLHSSGLSWECDYLRRESEAVRRGEADLIQQRNDYERLYKEEHETNVDLTRKLTERDEEFRCKGREMDEEVRSLGFQIKDLQQEIAKLKEENAATEAPSSSQLTTSRTAATILLHLFNSSAHNSFHRGLLPAALTQRNLQFSKISPKLPKAAIIPRTSCRGDVLSNRVKTVVAAFDCDVRLAYVCEFLFCVQC